GSFAGHDFSVSRISAPCWTDRRPRDRDNRARPLGCCGFAKSANRCRGARGRQESERFIGGGERFSRTSSGDGSFCSGDKKGHLAEVLGGGREAKFGSCGGHLRRV